MRPVAKAVIQRLQNEVPFHIGHRSADEQPGRNLSRSVRKRRGWYLESRRR
jgi:hypothetical protein